MSAQNMILLQAFRQQLYFFPHRLYPDIVIHQPYARQTECFI